MATQQRSVGSEPKISTMFIKRQYLIFYNAINLLLWSGLLQTVVYTLASSGLPSVYHASASLLRAVQTLAFAEVLHSLVGLVRAPVTTTAMQVASRLLLVWGIVWLFGQDLLVERQSLLRGRGEDTRAFWNQMAYLGMNVAWSLSECVRHGYFTYLLVAGGDAKSVPKWLTWTRYNMFQVLYPLGISCECWLVWRSLPSARVRDWRYEWFLVAVLVTYVPGE